MSDFITYAIRIQGHLDVKWSDWFEGLEIIHEPQGETTLCGPVPDQAGLYGLLIKIRDLGLPLLAVNRLSIADVQRQHGIHADPNAN